jgi:hypothetical protein
MRQTRHRGVAGCSRGVFINLSGLLQGVPVAVGRRGGWGCVTTVRSPGCFGTVLPPALCHPLTPSPPSPMQHQRATWRFLSGHVTTWPVCLRKMPARLFQTESPLLFPRPGMEHSRLPCTLIHGFLVCNPHLSCYCLSLLPLQLAPEGFLKNCCGGLSLVHQTGGSCFNYVAPEDSVPRYASGTLTPHLHRCQGTKCLQCHGWADSPEPFLSFTKKILALF